MQDTGGAEAAPSADNATMSSPTDSGSEPPVKRHTTELAQSDTQPKPPLDPERLERSRQRALEAAEYIEQVASQHASRTNSPVNGNGEEACKAAVSPAVRPRVTFAVPDVLHTHVRPVPSAVTVRCCADVAQARCAARRVGGGVDASEFDLPSSPLLLHRTLQM
jgi:hypothetical protein